MILKFGEKIVELNSPCILTINSGSSSIKFALFLIEQQKPRQIIVGKIDRIGLSNITMIITNPNTPEKSETRLLSTSSYLSSIRARICTGLEFLGIVLDDQWNTKNKNIISAERSKVAVHVIPTNEEQIIAQIVYHQLKY